VRKISWPVWALAGFVVFFATVDVLWLGYDHRPQAWDQSIHLSTALHYADVLRHSPASFLKEFVSFDTYYPPLVPVVGGAFALLSPSPDVMTWSMLCFIVLLAFSVFAVTRRRFGPEAAVAAAAIALCYPMVVRESHNFMLDVPLTALVVAAFDALDRTESFRNRGAALYFGILCGLGFLIKWMFPVFLLVPLLGSLVGILKKEEASNARRRNLWMALLATALVAGPWYLWNAPSLVLGFWQYGIKQGAYEGLPGVLTIPGFLFYPQILWENLTPLGVLLLLVGALSVYRNPKYRGLIWAVVVPVFVFTLLSNKKDRYVMPVLSFVAILSVAWLPRLGHGGRRAVSTVLVLSALMVIGSSVWPYGKRTSWKPDPADWKIETLLSRIPPGAPKILAVVPGQACLNEYNCSFYAQAFFPWVRARSLYNFPMFADYALIRTGDQGPRFGDSDKPRLRLTSELLDPISPTGKLFERVAAEPLPDGSTAYLFRRRTDLKVSDAVLRTALVRLMDRYVRDTKDFKFTVKSEMDGAKTLTVSFAEGFVGDYSHKPEALRMRNVNLTIRGLWINPESLAKGEVQILSVGSMDLVSAEVTREDLESFARPFAKGVSDLNVDFESGKVMVAGKAGRIPLRIEVKIYNRSREEANVYFKVEKVRIGFLTVPSALVNFLLKEHNPLLRKNSAPVTITFGEILIEDGVLKIRG
jgi:4-amino-4-deoxy-L-arabinose transferase-like glycosyltransferase